MTRRDVQLLLRHRDSSGKLDMDLVWAAQKERQQADEPEPEPFADMILIRRLQGWPEYLIDKMVRTLRGQADGG